MVQSPMSVAFRLTLSSREQVPVLTGRLRRQTAEAALDAGGRPGCVGGPGCEGQPHRITGWFMNACKCLKGFHTLADTLTISLRKCSTFIQMLLYFLPSDTVHQASCEHLIHAHGRELGKSQPCPQVTAVWG